MKATTLLPLLAISLGLSLTQAAGKMEVLFDSQAEPRIENTTTTETAVIQRLAYPIAQQNGSCDIGNDLAIKDVATGAFTRPGVRQRVVVYTVCYRGAHSLTALAIIEGQRLVAHYFNSGEAIAVASLADINKNGLNEILIRTYGRGAGGYQSNVSINEFSQNRLYQLHDQVANSGFCRFENSSLAEYSKIYIQSGKPLKLFTQTSEYVGGVEFCLDENTKPKFASRSKITPIQLSKTAWSGRL
jgi:hypothetical protein